MENILKASTKNMDREPLYDWQAVEGKRIRARSILEDGEELLRLYVADLDVLNAEEGGLFSGRLPPADVERAARFRGERLSARFLASHFLLLEALEDYAGTAVDLNLMACEPLEKPTLPFPGPQFSLSRSGAFGVVAVSRKHPVGVDIEIPRAAAMATELARRVLHPSEFAQWLSLEKARQEPVFFAIWRMKEAILKLTGEGLSRDPRQICLDLVKSDLRIQSLPESYPPLEAWRVGEVPESEPFPEVAWAACSQVSHQGVEQVSG